MMMNYVAFRLVEYLISGPLKDPLASTLQTRRIAPEAELWTLAAVPERLKDPWNALVVGWSSGWWWRLFSVRSFAASPPLGASKPRGSAGSFTWAGALRQA